MNTDNTILFNELIERLNQKRSLWDSSGNKEQRNMFGAYTDAIVIVKELQQSLTPSPSTKEEWEAEAENIYPYPDQKQWEGMKTGYHQRLTANLKVEAQRAAHVKCLELHYGRTVSPSIPKERAEYIDPIQMKAGDKRVLVNGSPLEVDYRIISEDNYQLLLGDKQ